MTAKLTARDLRYALRTVLPAADDGDEGLGLDAVMIEASDGVLTATATDRYVAARATVPADGDLPATLIPADMVRPIARMLRICDPAETIEVDHGRSGRFWVTSPEHRLSIQARDLKGYPARTIARLYERLSKPVDGDRLATIHIGTWPLSKVADILATAQKLTSTGQRRAASEWVMPDRIAGMGVRPVGIRAGAVEILLMPQRGDR